ncbi:MAG: ABC transporter ATP-binding protein [Erysipelotrichaceae bacterium]|nr:ABC transporter ATP-binding protein [Erysipelotrichaceae bacterium]
MTKLMIRYLKPFTWSVVAIIALLFVQAQTELALPDYMSEIVNTGIQTGGITSSLPEAIRASEYEKVKIFMDEDGITRMDDAYQLVTKENATMEQVESYPALSNEDVYLLQAEDTDALAQDMAIPQLLVMSLDGIASGETSTLDENSEEVKKIQKMMAQLPKGMDIFDGMRMMPKIEIQKMKDDMGNQLRSMGDSTLNTAATAFVKAEYQAIGMDTDAIQTNYILESGLKMLGMSLLSAICAIFVGLLASRLSAGIGLRMRGDVFKKVESFTSAEFNRFSTASLITRNTNDIQQVQMVIVMFIRIVLYAPIIGIGALLKVLDSNVSMTWIIALVLTVILGLIFTIFIVVMPKFKVIQKLIDRLNLVMREFLDGMSVIRAFNTQKYEEKKFDNANQEITKTNLFVNRAMAAMMPCMMFVMNGVALLIIWVGGKQMDVGSMQIGDIMAFIQYTMQIIMAFLMISMVAIMIPRAAVAGVRVKEVLDCEVSIQDPSKPKAFDETKKGYVVFDHVSFAYPGAEEDVLHDISFTAKPGQTTAFIGSTGSGKSTLINLVPRFYDVSDGHVSVDGVDVRDVSQKDLRERIGYVPQKGVLFSGTIASNLRYAKEDASDEELKEASRIAQALEFIETKPEQYETAISQGGTNVSGGQKQRLSIARALVKQPEIFIFDDSFSALDFKTDAKLRKELNQLCEKTKATVLVVAQRISSIMHADQIIVLDQGHVKGIGTHEELMKSCVVYQEIAYSQLSKEELEHE